MGSTAVEKTAEELRKEIEELHRQQWEITERLRDPRGIRRAGLTANGPRNFGGPNGVRQRGLIRPADRVDSEDQSAPKRRLSSAVVKVEEGELTEDAAGAKAAKEPDLTAEGGPAAMEATDRRAFDLQQRGSFRRDGNQRELRMMDIEAQPTEHVPRVLPKDEDPSLVKRNRRMLGQLLGTLEKFREEDQNLSTSEAYMRRSDSLRRAEQRAREESERLRQQEREQIAEKRRRDLTLRARVAAKAEEKKLELLFLRTKTEPPIFYLPTKPLDDDATVLEQRKEQAFHEWKAARREELSQYQRQIGEQYITNVEAELEKWQNTRNARKANSMMNLQETMDKELETHRLEHGPKTRKIPGGNEDEEDVEDIAGEDDMMDDMLEVDDNRRADDAAKPEAGNTSPNPD